MSVNKVILIGRLGQDPELKYLPAGTPVCNFSIATTETWKDKNTGQKQEKTEWHRIVVFGKLGEICNQYLAKGRQAYIEGRLQTRSWEDNDGKKRYSTEIIATNVTFVDSGSGNGNNNQSSDGSQGGSSMDGDYNPDYDPSMTGDDIPF